MPTTERRRQLERLADHLHLEYHEEDLWNLLPQLRDFRLFQKGRRGRIRHLLRRQEGLMEYDLRIFDYRYIVFNGKSNRPVEQTVFFLQSRKLGLPQCWMRPETFFHKVGELMGYDDIDFEEHPQFSGQYRLTGDDEEYIRYQFTKEVLHFFTVEKGWTLEGLGFYMLLYKKGQILRPSEIREMYEKGIQVYKLFAAESTS